MPNKIKINNGWLQKKKIIWSDLFPGINYINTDLLSKLLPCLTFCPVPSFKSTELSLNSESFRKNSYTMDDIFDKVTTTFLANKTEFSVTETESVVFGICITICILRKVEKYYFLVNCYS